MLETIQIMGLGIFAIAVFVIICWMVGLQTAYWRQLDLTTGEEIFVGMAIFAIPCGVLGFALLLGRWLVR